MWSVRAKLAAMRLAADDSGDGERAGGSQGWPGFSRGPPLEPVCRAGNGPLTL